MLNVTIAFFSVLGDAVSYLSRPAEGSKPSRMFLHGIKQLLGPKRASFSGHCWRG